MSIVQRLASFEKHACYMCGRATLVRADTHETPCCCGCARSNAEREAQRLLADVQALRDGHAPFDVLSPSERAEQLAALLPIAALPDEQLLKLAADAADAIADRMGSCLPTYRGGEAPDAAERQRIEDEDEQHHRELTMRRELADDEQYDGGML